MEYNELLEQMDHSLESLLEKLAHEGYVVIGANRAEENLSEEDISNLWGLYYDRGSTAVVEELEIRHGFDFDVQR